MLIFCNRNNYKGQVYITLYFNPFEDHCKGGNWPSFPDIGQLVFLALFV